MKPKLSDIVKILKQKDNTSDTLFVSDPKDKRIQAYKDSSDLYNFYLLQKQLDFKEDRYKPSTYEKLFGGYDTFKPEGRKRQKELLENAKNLLKNNPRLKVGLHSYPVATLKEYEDDGSTDIYQPNIKPKGIWMGSALNSNYSNVQPKQEVLYRKEQPVPVKKTKPKQKIIKPQPKVETKKLEPKKKEPVKKEELKPIERKQNIYEGSPVYSPGAGSGMPSALVGFRNKSGDTTYIKPDDYERFAVPKYGKAFIESKSKKK